MRKIKLFPDRISHFVQHHAQSVIEHPGGPRSTWTEYVFRGESFFLENEDHVVYDFYGPTAWSEEQIQSLKKEADKWIEERDALGYPVC